MSRQRTVREALSLMSFMRFATEITIRYLAPSNPSLNEFRSFDTAFRVFHKGIIDVLIAYGKSAVNLREQGLRIDEQSWENPPVSSVAALDEVSTLLNYAQAEWGNADNETTVPALDSLIRETGAFQLVYQHMDLAMGPISYAALQASPSASYVHPGSPVANCSDAKMWISKIGLYRMQCLILSSSACQTRDLGTENTLLFPSGIVEDPDEHKPLCLRVKAALQANLFIAALGDESPVDKQSSTWRWKRLAHISTVMQSTVSFISEKKGAG